MDVLNTYGGAISGGALFLAIVFAIFALLLIVGGFIEDDWGAVFCGIVCTAIVVCVVLKAEVPTRHEVTLRQGYVIDATKYEVIEQRGEIYVIEERDHAE